MPGQKGGVQRIRRDEVSGEAAGAGKQPEVLDAVGAMCHRFVRVTVWTDCRTGDDVNAAMAAMPSLRDPPDRR